MREFRITALVVAAVCCQLEARVDPQRLRRSMHWYDDADDELAQPHARSTRAAVTYFIQEQDRPDPSGGNICLTERCVRRSERILDALDHNINPCDNFAKYACGGRFLRDKTSGAGDSPTEYERKRNYINTFLKNTLEGDEQSTWTLAEQMAQKYYTTCKEDWFTAEMGKKLYKSLAQSLGADHLTDTDVKSAPKTLGALLRILDEQYGVQFAPAVTRFRNASNVCSILVHDGGDYKAYDENLDQASEEDLNNAGYSMEEGLELAELFTSKVKEACEDDTSIMQTTMRQLVRNSPEFGWPQFLNLDERSMTPIHIQGCVLKLTKDLFKLQMNYPMKLKTMFVARAIRRLWKKAEEDADTSNDCLEFTSKYFSPALTSMYISEPRHYVNLTGTPQLMASLMGALRERLERASWIDNPSRNFYINKLKDMRFYMGYDESIVEQKEDLEAHYFTVNVKGFLPADLTRLARWHYAAQDRNCDVVVWDDTSPLSVMGQYQMIGSALVAPLGLVSGTHYHPDQPSILNYAALGADLGLLLMFTLDKDFRDTDAWGNKYNISKNTLKNLDKAEECLHKHYQAGSSDDEEDKEDYASYTADLHGLKLASSAWRSQGGLTEQLLPGISELYSPQQIFYILYAQMNCNNAQTEEAGHERLVKTLSQIPEVAEMWKCPSGSNLNPTQQCKLW